MQSFYRHDGPTILVAIGIYVAWFLLIRFHAALPWWLIVPFGAYLIAWHFSLQHEAIHAFRGVPAWLRFAIVFPPLGLWFPFSLYRHSHSIHHRDQNLTVPGTDTESYYVRREDWQRMGAPHRALLLCNQTLLGRLAIGPLMRLWVLVRRRPVHTAGFRQLVYRKLRGKSHVSMYHCGNPMSNIAEVELTVDPLGGSLYRVVLTSKPAGGTRGPSCRAR